MSTTRKQFLKQTGFAIAGSFLPYSRIFGMQAKTIPDDLSHPKDCTKDLREPTTGVADSGYIFAADKIRQNYSNDLYTYNKSKKLVPNDTDMDPIKDVLYVADDGSGCRDTTIVSKACSYLNSHKPSQLETALKYKVTYAASNLQLGVGMGGHDYQAVKLPVMIILHPGGFKECTSYDDIFTEQLATEFARKGFVVFQIEYRTGRTVDGNGTLTSAQEHLAPYRGIQDIRAAAKLILTRNTANIANSNYKKFLIDPDQFFIGGASAGAGIALNVAYLRDQSMVDLHF